MKSNMKLILKLIILFLLIYSTIYYFNNKRTNNLISNELDHKVKMVKTNLESSLHHFKMATKNINHFLLNNKEIQDIIESAIIASNNDKKILREKLYIKLKEPYQRIKKFGGDIFHLVLPNNESFLRVHNKERYGDDLTPIRDSYKYVHDNKKPIFVFENGEFTCAYRYVYPLFNKNKKYIGAFEISYKTKNIQQNLLNINKLHTHIIINKELFKKHNYTKTEIEKYYVQSVEAKNYLFEKINTKTHNQIYKWEDEIIKPLSQKIEENIEKGKEFSFYKYLHNELKTITFLPIKDFKEFAKGYVIVYDKSENIENLLANKKTLDIVLFISLAGFFVFIFFILKQKELLKQKVKQQTQKLENLNKDLQKLVKEEVEKNRQKDKVILKQQKTVALGEMMDAIAHQWKQPLSLILLHVQELNIKYEYENKLDIKDIKILGDEVKKDVEHLLDTIDQFRSFFRPNQELLFVSLDEIVSSTLELMKLELIGNNIEVKTDIDKALQIKCIPNEIKHVFINIINNSKDAFNLKNIENRKISIEAFNDDLGLRVNIFDNAGGIPEDVIDKIFISNFTTKKESGGTGIGLYLVKQILDKLLAEIKVKNVDDGVCFNITFFSNH
jgi:signal transduction histidine kinase